MSRVPCQSTHRLYAHAGDAKKYKVYTAWANQTAAKPRPADPLKPRKTSKRGTSDEMAALQLAIRQKVGAWLPAACQLTGLHLALCWQAAQLCC